MITSRKNPKVKDWIKLKTKKERERRQLFLLEGYHLIEEAMRAQENITEIIGTKMALEHFTLTRQDIPTHLVSEAISQDMADTEKTQGIFAVVRSNPQLQKSHRKALLLDQVQDPGNLGTMIRSADAAGFDLVAMGKGTVDAYNQKVLRSAQGSHFHLDLAKVDLRDFIPKLQEQGLVVYGTDLSAESVPYKDLKARDKIAVLVGNEGQGMNSDLLDLVDQNTHIPIKGQAESLNVAIAASILMFHFSE